LGKHEEVAQIAADINKCIVQFQEEAKKFNSRENLFEMESTDYNKIQTM
jgi:dynein heavy chain